MEGLSELLDLQEVDSNIDALVHERESLPEIEALRDAEAHLELARGRLDEEETRRNDVAGEMKRLDDEAATLSSKIDEINTKLYGGAVKATRELLALQADLEMLERQRNEIEESELEVMVALDEAEAAIRLASEAMADSENDVRTARAELAAKQGEIDARLSEARGVRNEREAVVRDSGSLDMYNKLRDSEGGVVISRAHDGVCGACRLKISSVALEALRHESGIPRCEHCSMIVVV